VAYAGFLAILAGIITFLGGHISLWVAALLVGLIVAVVGYFLLQKGMDDLKKINFVPEETVESLKEDKEWLTREL
jgi:hypothetical protein